MLASENNWNQFVNTFEITSQIHSHSVESKLGLISFIAEMS